MKKYIAIFSVFIFSFASAGAQSQNVAASQSEDALPQTSEVCFKNVESITKINSDIRVLFNRERKVENIKIIFPKMNRRKLS